MMCKAIAVMVLLQGVAGVAGGPPGGPCDPKAPVDPCAPATAHWQVPPFNMTLPLSIPGMSQKEMEAAVKKLHGTLWYLGAPTAHGGIGELYKGLNAKVKDALKGTGLPQSVAEFVIRSMMLISQRLPPSVCNDPWLPLPPGSPCDTVRRLGQAATQKGAFKGQFSKLIDPRHNTVGACALRGNEADLQYTAEVVSKIAKVTGEAIDGKACSGAGLVEGLCSTDAAAGLMMALEKQVRVWLWDNKRPINPATDKMLAEEGPKHPEMKLEKTWKDISDGLLLFVIFPSFFNTNHFSLTQWFVDRAWSSCWEPSPFFNGPMIYKYNDVLAKMIDPTQRRGWTTFTCPASPKLTTKNTPLFLDGEHHKQLRELFEITDFARAWKIDEDLVRAVKPDAKYTDSDFGNQIIDAVAPSIMKGVYNDVPTPAVIKSIHTYSSYGGFGVFGIPMEENVLGPTGITGMLTKVRTDIRDWAKGTPYNKILLAARDAKFKDTFFEDTDDLVQSIADITLFAGVVGVRDMLNRCVKYQQKDDKHKAAFKEHPEKFLIELMRYEGSVAAVGQLIKEDTKMNVEGRTITFAKDTPMQLALSASNRDPVKWAKADEFDSTRSDLGDVLSWNGRTEDVEARNFAKAPRHCPGYCLSIKVGAALCAQMVDPQLFTDLLKEGKVGGDIKCNVFGAAPTPRLVNADHVVKANEATAFSLGNVGMLAMGLTVISFLGMGVRAMRRDRSTRQFRPLANSVCSIDGDDDDHEGQGLVEEHPSE